MNQPPLPATGLSPWWRHATILVMIGGCSGARSGSFERASGVSMPAGVVPILVATVRSLALRDASRVPSPI
jgi:hypothetical protein